MITREKVYRAYTSYGKHPLTDSKTLVSIAQARAKGKGKPKCKLYEKRSIDRGCHYSKTFLVKALMDSGMSYDEAIKTA